MPLTDITFRGNISPSAVVPCPKGAHETGGQRRDAAQVNVVQAAHQGDHCHDPSRRDYAAEGGFVADAAFHDGSEGSPVVQSLPAGGRQLDSASHVVTTSAAQGFRPSSRIDGIKFNDGAGYDDWETNLLCHPIQSSIDYLQPMQWNDKRSICVLCRGVSVQAGSEVRHCRGKTHRSAFALLQTLRFIDAKERGYIHQHTIEKNGQVVTAWRCILCDTKSLSHEYMNKHLLGKKHRQTANAELELEEWHNGCTTTVGFVDYQASQPMFPFPAVSNQDMADEHMACFLCRTHQFHTRCTYEHAFNHNSHDENEINRQLAPSSIDHSVNPNDIVRFLGLMSPEKPIMRHAGGERQNYDAALRDIGFLPPRLSPFNTESEDATDTPRSAYDFVNECLSYDNEAVGNRAPLPAIHSGWPSMPLDAMNVREGPGLYSIF